MLRLAQPQRFLHASSRSLKVIVPSVQSRSFSWSRTRCSSLDDWTHTIQAQATTMHDTADLNKARQVLLVLPKLSGPSSKVACSRSLIDKHNGEDVIALQRGSNMPLGSELVLFNPLLSESTLGADGTERSFGPPGGLDQRMWAGGSFEFEQGKQLKVGQDVQCNVTVESVLLKQGAKTGTMVLVTRKLVYEGAEGIVSTERRTHIYRKQRPADQRKYVPPPADKRPKATEGESAKSHVADNPEFDSLTINITRFTRYSGRKAI